MRGGLFEQKNTYARDAFQSAHFLFRINPPHFSLGSNQHRRRTQPLPAFFSYELFIINSKTYRYAVDFLVCVIGFAAYAPCCRVIILKSSALFILTHPSSKCLIRNSLRPAAGRLIKEITNAARFWIIILLNGSSRPALGEMKMYFHYLYFHFTATSCGM
jgi:hypothetical protein